MPDLPAPERPQPRSAPLRVAYLLDAFPVISETFIVREILELRGIGVDVSVFALGNESRRQSSIVVHADSEALASDVRYPREIRAGISKQRQVLLHIGFLLARPIRYFRLLWLCLRAGKRTFAHFRRSVMYASLLREERITHIHAHFSLNACTLAMLVSAWSDIPFSFTVHAHDIFIRGLADLMEHKLQAAKFVASISEFNKRHLMNAYPSVRGDKIRIVHCGIDLDKFLPAEAGTGQRLKLVSVGRLHEQKGFEYLIRACGLLKYEQGLDFTCDIIGEGEERPALEALILETGTRDVVRLLGAVGQDRVLNVLAAADVFVLPCVAAKSGAMDGIPVALMEAMAMEIPVISTRISGIPELIGSDAGMIVAPEDFRGLSDALFRLASLSHDERREFGRHGRATIEAHYNLETEANKLAALFADRTAAVSSSPFAI